ncbi:hypothetical protein C6558_39255, partial [Ensifer sp. NM-2]|uniref:hypothetical protein n=1 Tax=Ensifer sp. NM-2 TaxID=2109730 RepID=UPI000D4D8DD8
MRSLSMLLISAVMAGCSMPVVPEPSLAPRTAEAIDPRLPIPDETPAGSVDQALANRLAALVGEVRAAVPAFEAREAETRRLANAAGPAASESWIAAELSLS